MLEIGNRAWHRIAEQGVITLSHSVWRDMYENHAVKSAAFGLKIRIPETSEKFLV